MIIETSVLTENPLLALVMLVFVLLVLIETAIGVELAMLVIYILIAIKEFFKFVFSGFGKTKTERPRQTEDELFRCRPTMWHEEKNYPETYSGMFVYILFAGCFITSVGIGMNLELAFGIGVTMIVFSVIATRIIENREFQTIDHGLDLYQQTKLQNGIVTFGLGAMFLIATVYLTGIIAIDYYTMPSLIVLGIGAGKMMKFSFIKRSSPEMLSFVIKVKYFYKDTTKLIAKTMEYKMSQQAQRVAT